MGNKGSRNSASRTPSPQVQTQRSLGGSSSQQQSTASSSSSTRTQGSQQPSASMQQTVVQSAQQRSNPVRCPRCRRLLQPPAGHERFLCPCGQMLMAPSSTVAPPNRPVHVRCPTCSSTLMPPPNAPIFRCPCGTHLRAPSSALSSTGSSQARLDISGGMGGGDARKDEVLMNASQQQIVATLAQLRGEQQWLRKTGPDGTSLVWVNLQSDDDEKRKLDMEATCFKELDKNVNSMDTKALYTKLEEMGIETDMADTKEDLQELLRSAPERLIQVPTKELMRRLDNLGVSYDTIIEKDELVNRLIAASWYSGLYDAGYCRSVRPDHSLEWVPAQRVKVPTDSGLRPLNPDLLMHMSAQPFMAKLKWFREQLAATKIKWEDGRVQVKVRRGEILRDSFSNLNKLSPQDMLRFWRFQFVGEEGIDAGGLAREWFQLVTDQCFNVDFGLFEYSGVDNICYQINPSSGIANELHLKYFYFLGRVMGKAIFDGHNISAHMARPYYKHLLGYPITLDDIEFVDGQIHKSMKDIRECDDVEMLCLTFSTSEKVFGETQVIDLKPDGQNVDVTNENREAYLHLLIKYMLFDRVSSQLAMLLRGFLEVIPQNLLCVFDYHELELLLCGLPNINVADWKSNTQYRGVYAQKAAKTHQCVVWFWELIDEFSDEQRARFLQFATGTSRVPVQGFGALQGNDGSIKPFTIDSIPFKTSVFPKAHTCFNRIELPLYDSKDQMRKYILQALQLEAVGFQTE